MCDVKKLCEKYGVNVPDPIVDSRGRIVYKAEIRDAMTMVIVGREMVLAGCKPSAGISQWNDSTVTLTERRRKEAWVFKYYASNQNQAECVLTDVLDAIKPHRQFQETFDL